MNLSDAIEKFLGRLMKITDDELANGHQSPDNLLRNTMEELGEYAAARTVELGLKNKTLKESAKVEAVDHLICSFSLYFAEGGTVEELIKIGNVKLDKWQDRLSKRKDAKKKKKKSKKK